MKKHKIRLIEKTDLYNSGKLWRLRWDAPDIEAEPGQFVNIEIEGKYLRRPISVSEYQESVLSIVVDVVGDGTRRLVETAIGAELDVLSGLGNRFTVNPNIDGKKVILIGGGVGYAPLVGLLKKIKLDTDFEPLAVFGFNRETDVPLHHIEELRAENFPVEFCTMNGEKGLQGNVIEVAESLMASSGFRPEYFYTCGPLGMMKAVCHTFNFEGELSMEARMGCGFGACMGCSIQTAFGTKRICREGPVFKKSEILDYAL